MASLDDILTATKNAVSAINSAAQTYLSVWGKSNQASITATTLVSSSSGRLVNVSVVSTSTTTGAIYDSNNTAITSRPIYTIPAAVGVYQVNIPVNYGILVSPGTSQNVTVSYS